MPLVVLKRNWRTPMGGFNVGDDGLPTFIPQQVIDRWKLPSDAKPVKDDYKTPAQIAEENAGIDPSAPETDEMVRARIAKAIDDGINAKIAEMDAETLQAVADANAKRSQENADRLSGEGASEGTADDTNKGNEGGPDAVDSDALIELLSRSVKDIEPSLEGMSFEALTEMLALEQSGQARSSLVILIEAELEDFNG